MTGRGQSERTKGTDIKGHGGSMEGANYQLPQGDLSGDLWISSKASYLRRSRSNVSLLCL